MSQQSLHSRVKSCVDDVKKLNQTRTSLASLLEKEAGKLNKMGKDVRISQIAGSVAGVVGGVMVIAGTLGAPITGGASLSVSAAGAGLSALGTATGLGATIVNQVISDSTRNQYSKSINKEKDLFKQVIADLQYIVKELEFALITSKEMASYANATLSVLDSLKVSSELVKFGGDILTKFSKGIKMGGKVLQVISLPVDVYTIVSNSIDIYNDNPHELGREFMQLVDKIRTGQDKLTDMERKFETLLT